MDKHSNTVRATNVTTISLKRLCFIFLICTVAFCNGGCIIETSSPLVDPASASVDTTLLGTWTGTDPVNHSTTDEYTIERGDIGGMMTVHEHIVDPKSGKSEDGQLLFTATTINGYGYICLYPGKSTGQNYSVVRYRVDGDTLRTWFGSTDVERKLIQQGSIEGKITPGESKDPIAQSASLVQYLENNSGDELFPEKSDDDFSSAMMSLSRKRMANEQPASAAPESSTPSSTTVTRPATATEPVAVATGTSPNANNHPDSLNVITVLPWLILAFIAGLYVASRFTKQKPR